MNPSKFACERVWRTRWNYSDEIKWREFIFKDVLAAVAVAWLPQSYCKTSAVVCEGFISTFNVKNIAKKQRKQTNRKKSNKIREMCGTGNNRAQSLSDNWRRACISKREAGLHIPITFITADKWNICMFVTFYATTTTSHDEHIVILGYTCTTNHS